MQVPRIFQVVVLLTLLAMAGMFGFRIIEGAPWLDCLYMAVITLTTVGFEEVFELSPAGRMFVIVYLVCGLGMFTYSATMLGQWIVSVRMRSALEKRRMNKRINRLDNHSIVCGLGRMGRTICQYLDDHNKPFVIIDTDEELLRENCEFKHNWPYVVGDATDDAVLKAAGIDRALSLTTVLPTDADNVYVILSANMLRDDLLIVARASDEKAVDKIKRAGAARVVSPFSSGAMKMARFLLYPSIEDFLEIADTGGGELELAEVQITESSPYVGKSLQETSLSRSGIMVIGIRRESGERLMPPPGSATIEDGDSLFVFGPSTAVNDMTATINAI